MIYEPWGISFPVRVIYRLLSMVAPLTKASEAIRHVTVTKRLFVELKLMFKAAAAALTCRFCCF